MEPNVRQLSDPTDLRALAHPVRMSILEQLIVFGPQTATQLAARIDESPANCSWHLRKLAEHGFVEEAGGGTGRERPWQAASRGLSWREQDASESAQLAGEALTAVLVDREVARYAEARRWLGDDEPAWRAAAGSSQGAMWVTEDEFAELTQEMGRLVMRYLERMDDPSLRPPGSRLVTVMGWAVPAYHPDGRPVTAEDAAAPTGVSADEATHGATGRTDEQGPSRRDGRKEA